MNYLKMTDFSFFCFDHLNIYALHIKYNSLYSVVVMSLAFRSEIAGSNPGFAKL